MTTTTTTNGHDLDLMEDRDERGRFWQVECWCGFDEYFNSREAAMEAADEHLADTATVYCQVCDIADDECYGEFDYDARLCGSESCGWEYGSDLYGE